MAKLRRNLPALTIVVIVLFSIPLLLVAFRGAADYLSRAAARPANIKVDAEEVVGPLPQIWRAIAQGGEDSDRTLFQVRDEIRELGPRYVRLDHIYDQYNVVRQEQGKISYDWSELDQTVRDILAGGSKPFFSLSYLPPDLSGDGTVLGKPSDWGEWQELVRETVEHYSGRDGFGIDGVYYEVWNEPDLFGGWRIYGEKNYLDLYYYAGRGAQEAENTRRFFFGGPGTTAPYRNWVTGLVKRAQDTDLPLDFISWHRYSTGPAVYRKDLNDVKNWLSFFPEYAQATLVVSEFTVDSENNPAHDNRIGAAHTAAVVRELLPELELLFSFELKDGLSPNQEEYWGRWGIVTADKFGNKKKPRYYALLLLNRLAGENGRRLSLSGEGDFVKAIAAREFSEVRVLLVNYDPRDQHAERVPVTLSGLSHPRYRLTTRDLSGNKRSKIKLAENGVITDEFLLPPNSVLLITLTPG